MQLIAVDIGNSSTKIAAEPIGEDARWTEHVIIRGNDAIKVDLAPEPAFWSICSVNSQRLGVLKDWITAERPNDQIHVISPSDVELSSDVESREKVGRDRLVAALLAVQLNGNEGPLIVIDAGTAVTIDLVDANNIFQGGVIFPGAASTLKSLSASTDALPDLSDRKYLELVEDLESVLGKSTFPAIVRGVYQCQLGGILHIVNAYQSKFDKPIPVYATGGGIFDLQIGLPKDWNFVHDLVLQGAKDIGKKLVAQKSE